MIGRALGLAAVAVLLPAVAWAAPACTVRRGTGETVIRATILTPDRVLAPGEVRIDAAGRIDCVGARCAARPDATRILCHDAVLSPGFINTHDHIDFDNIGPRPDTGERYAHRHEWRKGLDGHRQLQDFKPDRDPLSVSWTELRFLVGGTTSTVAERMAPGLLRNLDFRDGLEGVAMTPATYRIFPLDDASGIMRTRDCDYGPQPATHDLVAHGGAFLAHVSEGRDEAARNEFRCESSETYDTTPQPGGGGTSHDWIMPQAVLIHAVALTPEDLDLVAARHASLVWSPRSNLSLYGQTMKVLAARQRGITIALGSDWLPSGSMNMNRELACAVRYDHGHLHDALGDAVLWRMVTLDAARVAGAEKEIGSIAVGKLADLVLFADPAHRGVHAVVRATPQDDMLVLRGGRMLVGRSDIVDRLRPDCAAIAVPGAALELCPEPGRASAAELSAHAAAHGLYPLAFAGTPPDEPPCETAP
ncbi:amidohydrolase family protein [Gluconacetobacter takamatsuzukensis]|uniref:Amidohydrolase family protein n=1 Tax=Gluconacetobacter takamatsuzukensis TaxID=1286190 RepID=A0A7W4KF10_9PROT|nr:amidohydrolase family protein [Gluconacetobacter takamatsuzukensis]